MIGYFFINCTTTSTVPSCKTKLIPLRKWNIGFMVLTCIAIILIIIESIAIINKDNKVLIATIIILFELLLIQYRYNHNFFNIILIIIIFTIPAMIISKIFSPIMEKLSVLVLVFFIVIIIWCYIYENIIIPIIVERLDLDIVDRYDEKNILYENEENKEIEKNILYENEENKETKKLLQ